MLCIQALHGDLQAILVQVFGDNSRCYQYCSWCVNEYTLTVLLIFNISDFIWPFLKPYMGVIPNPKMAYGKCSKISNTLKLRTPKIIAENNF